MSFDSRPMWRILKERLIEMGFSESVAYRAAVEEMAVILDRAKQRAETIQASETK